MSQFRKDPVTGRWVIIAPERVKALIHNENSGEISSEENSCQLCEGMEKSTPSEISSFRRPGSKSDTPGWWIRVIPHPFRRLHIEEQLLKQGVGMFDQMNGIGAHEVLIATPKHNSPLHKFSEKQIEEILWMYKERISDLLKDERLKYVLVFKNHGRIAGAQWNHSHSELIAIPTVPKVIKEEIEGAKAYFKYKDRCVFCDILNQELKEKERIVVRGNAHVAFTPFASRFPFECWILPVSHSHNFTTIGEKEISDLAKVLHEVLQRLALALNEPAYSYVLHTAPKEEDESNKFFHWHLEIIPLVVRVAGFEWGSGFYLNPTPPEEAAGYMRDLKISNFKF